MKPSESDSVPSPVAAVQTAVAKVPFTQRLTAHLLIGLALSVVFLILFAALAEDVASHESIVQFDQALADALHALATPTTTNGFILISLLGAQVLDVIAVAVAVLYIVQRRWWHAGIWITALAGGEVLNLLLKLAFARPRPYFANPLIVEANYSFPSGHAMWSFVAYGMLAYLALPDLKRRGARWLMIAGAAFLVFMIGLSRIYLGVHYFSDVIGGYVAAAVWLSVCITAAQALRRREPPVPDAGSQTAAGVSNTLVSVNK